MKHGIPKKDKMYLVKKVYVGWDLVPANSKKEVKEIISDTYSYIKEIFDDGSIDRVHLSYEDVGWIKIKAKKMISKSLFFKEQTHADFLFNHRFKLNHKIL